MTYFDKVNNRTRNLLQWVMYDCGKDCDKGLLGENFGDGGKVGMLGGVEATFNSTVGFRPEPNAAYIPKTVPFFLDSTSTKI